MLNLEELKVLREHLERAQNPVFYYDNDADGLASFLLLRRFIGRGKGVAVRSYPDLNLQYARKAREFNADYVFVLDKPVISREFFEEVEKMGLPLIWIDHHDVPEGKLAKEFKNVEVFNPAIKSGKDKSEEPVTSICYELTKRKEDMWIAVVGCIADHYMPDFYEEFMKDYPDFAGNVKDPFEALFETEIGNVAQAFNFGLKDSTSNIVYFQNYLLECNSPVMVLEEDKKNFNFRKKYTSIKKKYDELVNKARGHIYGNLLFFIYGGDLSISAELSNQLSHEFKEKYVLVCYKRGGIINVSLRGKGIKKHLEEFLEKHPNATGGGHEDACGARISAEELDDLKEFFMGASSKENK